MAKKAKAALRQKAIFITIPFATAPGAALDELNAHLALGWQVIDVTTFENEAENGPLSVLVIIEGKAKLSEPKAPKEETAKPEKEEKPAKEKKEKKGKKEKSEKKEKKAKNTKKEKKQKAE
mgnify:CR=1 FL=1